MTDENYVVGITGRRTELLNELKIQKPDQFYPKTFDITDTNKIVENLEDLTKQRTANSFIVGNRYCDDKHIQSKNVKIKLTVIKRSNSNF